MLALGALCLVLLILLLPGWKSSIFKGSEHPASATGRLAKQETAIQYLHHLGYDRPEGASGHARQIRSEYGNHVRYHFGREALAEARSSHPAHTPPSWHYVFSLGTSHARDHFLRMLLFDQDELRDADEGSFTFEERRFRIHTDPLGIPFELATSGRQRFAHEQPNRRMLEQALGRPLPPETVRIHLQQPSSTGNRFAEDTLVLMEADTRQLVQHVLAPTRWSGAELTLDEISIQNESGEHTLYRIRMRAEEEILGRTLRIDTDIDHQGYVHRIQPSWVVVNTDTESLPVAVHNQSRTTVLVLLGIAAFFVFLFRLVRQQLDLKSARNDALITFVAMFLVSLNSSFSEALQHGYLAPDLWDLIGTILGGVLVGAGSAALIFIFSSIASSVSHEIWPERIHSLNLFRRGYLYNKPVGLALVRALSLALLIPVLPVVIHSLHPGAEIFTDGDFIFMTEQFPVAFAHTLGQSAYAAQQILFIVLLFALALIRKRIQHPWLLNGIGVMILIWLDLNPAQLIGYGNLAGQFVAAVLVMSAFHRFGALTAMLLPFFTQLWWALLGGLALGVGPDGYQLLFLAGILIVALIMGVMATGYGAAGTSLPDFVPSYILDLANRERMTRELEIARQVQQTFLPVSNPSIEDFELYASCKPASEVGGDYYEFLQADAHTVAVSIGDVSGKGIQAAFFMTLIKGYTQSLAETGPDPATFLSRVNSLFYRNAPRGTFVTMIYGLLDTRNRSFTLARAGHNPVLVYRAATGKATYLHTPGLALGMINDSRFESQLEAVTLQLEAGDCILLYTDGYTEAMNRAGELYGDARFKEIVEQHGTKSLGQLVDIIDTDVHAFTGGIARHDDMTIMGIRVR